MARVLVLVFNSMYYTSNIHKLEATFIRTFEKCIQEPSLLYYKYAQMENS